MRVGDGFYGSWISVAINVGAEEELRKPEYVIDATLAGFGVKALERTALFKCPGPSGTIDPLNMIATVAVKYRPATYFWPWRPFVSAFKVFRMLWRPL